MELLWGSRKAMFLSHKPCEHQLSGSKAEPGKEPQITFDHAHAVSLLEEMSSSLGGAGRSKIIQSTPKSYLSCHLLLVSSLLINSFILIIQDAAEELAGLYSTLRLGAMGSFSYSCNPSAFHRHLQVCPRIQKALRSSPF